MSLVSGDYGSGSEDENSKEEVKADEMEQDNQISPDKKRPRDEQPESLEVVSEPPAKKPKLTLPSMFNVPLEAKQTPNQASTKGGVARSLVPPQVRNARPNKVTEDSGAWGPDKKKKVVAKNQQ
eukprot:TRINITY_DN4841_c0_g1_i1.p1 TRINITY_DN4841_c0_g1~~TRINITY_DN4841_c0_g1_i1.p1  ORF type:complete len:124 (-),score=14.22 TRINITY_DN4841_c0_g1_i1:80-451(-)